MALKDMIQDHRAKVFMNPNHFATTHTWNGRPFTCVVDDDEALKRKNNNVNDISWDNNHQETFIYVREEDWPGRKVPNEHGWFDNRQYKRFTRTWGYWGSCWSASSPNPLRVMIIKGAFRSPP